MFIALLYFDELLLLLNLNKFKLLIKYPSIRIDIRTSWCRMERQIIKITSLFTDADIRNSSIIYTRVYKKYSIYKIDIKNNAHNISDTIFFNCLECFYHKDNISKRLKKK